LSETDDVLSKWAKDLRDEEQEIENKINEAAERIKKANEEEGA
jgi:hypothetical protein